MSSSESLASAMTGRVECLAVLPAAPDDPDPGAGEDTDRVGMAASSFDGTSVDVGRPGVGHSMPLAKSMTADRSFLAHPAEHGLLALARLPGRWRCPSQRSQGIVGGEAFAAVADLGEQAGRPHHPRSRKTCEDVLVWMSAEQHRHLLLDRLHLHVQGFDHATRARVMVPPACPSAPNRPGAASVGRSKRTAAEMPPQ